MQLLVVNWQDRLNPWAGGAEVHLHEIFRRLADRGHEITLLVSGWPGAPEEAVVDGMEVRRTGGRYSFPIHARRAFRRQVTHRAFDLVVEDINKLPLFTPAWSDVPVAAIVPHLFGTTAFRQESLPVAATVWAAERWIPRVYRDVTFEAISRSTANDLIERGIDPERIRVSYPGLDHSVYRPAEEERRYPEPTIACVGRLRRYKGVDVVLRALQQLRSEGLVIRLLVVGQGDDSGRLQKLAGRLGLLDQVEFRGFVPEDEKVRILQRSWCVVYPSPKEGWGISVVEAAACGTPTLASDSPGLREAVADEETGVLVPHDDGFAWASQLRRICDDADLRQRFARGGIQHASRFSWEATAAETEAILQSVLER